MRFTLIALVLFFVIPFSVVCAADLAGEIPAPKIPEPALRIERGAEYRPPLAAWKWSLAPLAASQGLDIASSYGMRELNPLLAGSRGEFGMKAAAIKAGMTAAFVGVEYLIVKAHPRAAKIFTKMNWSGAALTTGFAAHNFAIR